MDCGCDGGLVACWVVVDGERGVVARRKDCRGGGAVRVVCACC